MPLGDFRHSLKPIFIQGNLKKLAGDWLVESRCYGVQNGIWSCSFLRAWHQVNISANYESRSMLPFYTSFRTSCLTRWASASLSQLYCPCCSLLISVVISVCIADPLFCAYYIDCCELHIRTPCCELFKYRRSIPDQWPVLAVNDHFTLFLPEWEEPIHSLRVDSESVIAMIAVKPASPCPLPLSSTDSKTLSCSAY